MAQANQTYKNHVRFFPLFHFIAVPILLANMLREGWLLYKAPSTAAGWQFVVAFALVAGILSARVMALAVQDRVIRLEMRMRLREVLPADLQPRILDLTRGQLVGLRFGSDAELPDLVRQVLNGSLKTPRDIKKAVTHWQGDYLRA